MTPLIPPTDAELELYRLGRKGEARSIYRERTQCEQDTAILAFHPDRERQYARAEAASAIVKAARRWRDGLGTPEDMFLRNDLATAVDEYENLIGQED